MQLARFLFIQSPFEGNYGNHFNKEQIKEYVDDSLNFFVQMNKQSKSEEEQIYWGDCLDLLENWKNVKSWMDWQDTPPTIDMFNYSKKAIENMSDDKYKNILSMFEEHKKIYDLFNEKKSDEKQPTLIDVPIIF